MDIRFQAGGPKKWKGDIALLFCFKDQDPANLFPAIEDMAPWLTIAPGRRDFDGSKGSMALFHGHPDQSLSRVLAIGLGTEKSFNLNVFRTAMAAAMARCRELGLTSVLLPVPALQAIADGHLRLVEEATCAAFLGLYRFTAHKSPKEDDKKDPLWLALGFTEKSVPDAEHKAARRGEYTAEGIIFARDLANSPANVLPPMALAKAAKKMAKKHAMQCQIMDKKALEKMGCNTLLAVGQGSSEPPCMITIEHAPKGHEQEEPIILVGKGLTFDSGGISIKPAANMHLMKCDMAGAAAVLGAMHAIGQCDIERRVIAVLACAENMPDGSAMRPGDVITTLSGKTVEIINTDAEGRLALCDALTYAQNTWEPALLIDIATLTGACIIALGHDIAGLFCDDKTLTEEICNMGGALGENFWPLPLHEAYEDELKSNVADLSHLGSREAGSTKAALYLKAFINENTLWAHMDIAGTDWNFKKSALAPVGATGFGVRTLLELVRSYKK